MSPEQKLAVTVTESRLKRAARLADECRDDTGKLPVLGSCTRAMEIAGKISVLTSLSDSSTDLAEQKEIDFCPSANSPRCPIYQEVGVVLPDNVTELDSRRAS